MYVQVLKEHKAVGEELYKEGSTVTLLICRAILSRYAHIAADGRRRSIARMAARSCAHATVYALRTHTHTTLHRFCPRPRP